jgi:hypothetical protein
MRIFMALACLCAISGRCCSAQVWQPPKGEGSFSITYQNVVFAGHFLDDGSRDPPGEDGSAARNIIAEWDYGLTNRVGVSLSLPYTWNKYTGTSPPVQPSALDDRRYHGTFLDFRLQTAINLTQKPLVITPIFALVVPSHNYPLIGEAAPGRGMNEFWVGIGVGRLLAPVLPRAYVQARYVYAVVERVLNIGTNRSNVDWAAGYFISPRLSVTGSGGWQRTHGGLIFDEIDAAEINDPIKFYNHDRLVRANYLHAGVGGTISISPTLDLEASMTRFISGSSTHYGWATTVGLTWNFQTSRSRANALPPLPPSVPARQ